jgi:hypothetical protein
MLEHCFEGKDYSSEQADSCLQKKCKTVQGEEKFKSVHGGGLRFRLF